MHRSRRRGTTNPLIRLSTRHAVRGRPESGGRDIDGKGQPMTGTAPQTPGTNRPHTADTYLFGATCTASRAGRRLDRHGPPRSGPRAGAELTIASDRPDRVRASRVAVAPPPQLSGQRRDPLSAAAHDTVQQPPAVDVEAEP
ncbi:hypothetical protein [Streptomyces sp. bgisy034]|uniref:hypothetical protein n=2 Tax=unclassified Streptomyces TaxID=2593676 RepID=UPI003EC13EBD